MAQACQVTDCSADYFLDLRSRSCRVRRSQAWESTTPEPKLSEWTDTAISALNSIGLLPPDSRLL